MPNPAPQSPVEDKQCRICLDGEDPHLGRLIRPCLCRGSISYVHVKCLQQWRNTSTSSSAFFSCPQCHYRYHFARTQVYGVATNPVVVGALSSIIFTVLVFLSSFITTYFLKTLEDGSSYGSSSWYYHSSYWTSPYDVGKDLVRVALRILKEESGIIDESFLNKVTKSTPQATMGPLTAPEAAKAASSGLLKTFFQRLLLGLPVVSAGSLVHMLLSFPLLGPVHWIARYRGNRGRRDSTRDVAAIVVVALLVVGAARALWAVYQLTEKVTKRVLLRAEDAILEVN